MGFIRSDVQSRLPLPSPLSYSVSKTFICFFPPRLSPHSPFSWRSLLLIVSPFFFSLSFSFPSHSSLRCSALEPLAPSLGQPWRCRGPLSPSVVSLCLPASHWLSGSGGFLSLHLSLSLSLPVSLPPALRCTASSPRSFFLPLPLTALTPFLCFPLLSSSVSPLPAALI